MNMKSVIFLLAGLLIFFSPVFAHPPSKIVISFDKEKGILESLVYHDVKNPKNHFIKEIIVSVNGKEAVKKEFDHQDNKDTQTFTTSLVSLKPGDHIAVQAECSVFGKLTEGLEIK